jgi:8-oxo-dGTP pyrophosphatase MutT (NUDIX family)
MMAFDPAQFRRDLLILLNRHYDAFGLPEGSHALLRRQIERGDEVHDRRCFPGHVTTSAVILNQDGTETLLVRHRGLGRWLQPGGHFEPPGTLMASALREASEETGLPGLAVDAWHQVSGSPIDIDTHRIPARPIRDEPEHWHHDFRFIVRARSTDELKPDLAETEGASWRPVVDLSAVAPQALANLRRLGLVCMTP